MPKKLQQRVLTALILIPSVVGGIMYLSSTVLAIALSIFVLLAAWEWTDICGWHTNPARASYTILIISGLITAFLILKFHPINIYPILIIAVAWWLLMLYWQTGVQYDWLHDPVPKSSWVKAILGIVILVPAWTALVYLHQHYTGYSVLFFFSLIWLADSSAYFIGKAWGKHKLAVKISPKKTWEGVYGAIGSGLLLSLSYTLWRNMTVHESLLFIGLCFITILVSILGDLAESMFKRQMHLKDSSQLLPGHGGMLDRVDSLTSAAPIFVIGTILLGIRF
ncbi:phosphatidate cytidylyltransferase [Candidatus Albibeggiatoa sp. nov. BB20]|uniref:phosphatidate cytidylyltransferase n=1 Tax=Candidatus Albibeggiatoa sp. nov. BB20 TaxID=3162723 RepID=UPI0033657A33